mmetsp:Transcript_6594/g.21347  ORF Transcript_6594/g.21347 Transcript_6594/m.21347 type:complete len:204 (+) Transcript_6594:206-817(+)
MSANGFVGGGLESVAGSESDAGGGGLASLKSMSGAGSDEGGEDAPPTRVFPLDRPPFGANTGLAAGLAGELSASGGGMPRRSDSSASRLDRMRSLSASRRATVSSSVPEAGPPMSSLSICCTQMAPSSPCLPSGSATSSLVSFCPGGRRICETMSCSSDCDVSSASRRLPTDARRARPDSSGDGREGGRSSRESASSSDARSS